MTRPSWLGRAVRNRHRHAIEQASRRWRGGRRDDARTRRKILIFTQVNEITKSIVATNPLSVKVFVTDKEREELVPLRKGSLKKSETFFASRKQSLSRLADHDIVIVTYNTMLAGGARQGLYGTPGDVNPIEQIRWTRVAVRNQPVRRVHPTTLH